MTTTSSLMSMGRVLLIVTSVGSWWGLRRSRGRNEEWLAFFDDVRGELRCVARTDVLRRMDRSCRNEQDVSRLEGLWGLPLDPILQRTFENVDDLLAGMRVSGSGHALVETD